MRLRPHVPIASEKRPGIAVPHVPHAPFFMSEEITAKHTKSTKGRRADLE
jgi:hypothetical protein